MKVMLLMKFYLINQLNNIKSRGIFKSVKSNIKNLKNDNQKKIIDIIC